MSASLRVGIVGVGVISRQYLAQLATRPEVDVVAVADLDVDRAAAVAAEHGIRALSVDELMAEDGVDLVLNLTIPAAHVEVALAALSAGKHVYGEKPLALDTASGQRVLDAAARARLLVGSAPDTVLGVGVQTARRALDDGLIGEAVSASVHWTAPGHELWHPAPAFYYQPGAGPLFDMGPYYLTTLVTLFGPVARVSGLATRSARARTIATGPDAGAAIPVDVDTHVLALLEHASGVTASVTVSFEVWQSRAPLFEVYGTAGTLAVPDPNTFEGPAELWTPESGEWAVLPDAAGYAAGGRGIGIVDLAAAAAEGRSPRCSGELAFHVLEVMEAVLAGGEREIRSRPARPEPVPHTPAG
ncbi:MAG: Gfo/Idh/MocA family oxidoreductase [Micrococcales bacterium]|nr:Gfo/Idh/MocA family oxidoreductase [Micrococcales bacterium]